MQRTVTGLIKKLDGTPWADLPISFDLEPGGFQTTEDKPNYPGQLLPVVTGIDGRFTTQLWANEGGAIASTYICTFYNQSFSFTLPVGTEPIDLTDLRLLGVEPFPSPFPKPIIRQLFVPTSGQGSFTLLSVPKYPHLSRVWLNGVKAVFPSDYTINSLVLAWLSPIRLEPNDFFEVLY